MGKCISKNPTSLTIALSEKDLATASHILSKLTESSEYVALKDEHRNQLCEYYAVISSSSSSSASQKTVQPQQEQRQHQQQQNSKDDFTQENSCLHSLDHWTVTKSVQKQQIVNNDDKSNDAVDDVHHGTNNSNISSNKGNYDYGDVVESMLVYNNHIQVDYDSEDNIEDEDKYITIIKCSSSCSDNNNNNNNRGSKENIIYADINLANCDNNNIKNSNTNNNDNEYNHYYAEMPSYLRQLLLYQQHKKQREQEQSPDNPTQRNSSLIDNCLSNKKLGNKYHKVKKKWKKSLKPDDGTLETLDVNLKGQAESKKNSKKHNAGEIQTKGTAMSFGFRKNLNTTPKKLKKLIKGENNKHSKKQDKCNANDSDNTEQTGGGIGGGTGLNTGDGSFKTDTVIDTNNKTCTDKLVSRDDNGNADLLNNVHFEKMGAAAAATAQINQNTDTGSIGNVKLPGAGNRFGFRGSYRPSSTDITSRQQRESNDNIENNNYAANGSNTKGVLVSNLKRRSKSAHAGRTTSSSNESDNETGPAPRNTQTKTITFNLKQNSTIEYDRRQFFEQPALYTQTSIATIGNINSRASYNMAAGLQYHNNVIVRPTPRVAATAMATAYSKFTLQTVSLPKPEFPVAISISATTPTTPANNSYVSSPAMGTGTRTRDHSSGRHPLTVAQSSSAHGAQRMDAKQAKHMTNSTRRSFSGSREISADSGIASLDMALDSSTSSGAGSVKGTASPKRSRSRPRNLQMVMNGRHRFEVKDLDDSLSSESSSIVEPLALPKLPAENQTVPLPLSGLIRSNTVLSRESYELRNSVAKHKENTSAADTKPQHQSIINLISRQPSEEDSESLDEEKLHLDRSATEKGYKERQFKDINTCSSKTSSPGSSVISSWCNAGESLAANDFSNLSISSSEDSNKQDNKMLEDRKENEHKLSFDLNDDDLVTLNTDIPISTLSSSTEPLPLNINDETDNAVKLNTTLAIFEKEIDLRFERPNSFCSTLNETKFAEMALEGSTFLLDDETSPTDSLVSSTESEEAACKQKKHKINEELQEKDIDEISPELDLASPLSPGTPTHASHSLSLSDCGNLIDDEIADQPALLFNQESQDGGAESGTSRRDKTDTPTLMESMGSMRASINKSRSALHQAMELSLRTPLSLRKAVMERAESLDTLSPCESICSDDLMMDFDVASSMDSIDRSASIKSRSGSDLNNIDDNELFSEFDRKGSAVMKELNSILRTRSQKNNDNKDITAHLPARATRLLNRSRMQQHCTLNNDDSDSTKSPLAGRRRTNTASSRTSTASSTNNNSSNNRTNNSANSSLQRKFPHHHHYHYHQTSSSFHQRDTHSSSDDLMLYDKSFRNAMIQDVLQFKKQLLRLRKILQETETLNPFENDNGQLFTSCGLDSKLLDDIDLASLTSSTTDDPIQELADLRRQVVYLQGQVDDRDRTIRLQKNLIEKLEAEKLKAPHAANEIATKECVDTATQTERTRPLTIGTESLSRSKPEYTSYTTYFPAICSDSTTIIEHHQKNPGCLANNQTRRHTIISTTLTNYNQQLSTPRHTPRRASIAWEKQTPSYKPVKITLIGDPLKHWQSEGNSLNKSKDEEFSKNFINTNLNRQQHIQKDQLTQQENAHNNNNNNNNNNNIILNSKHHHRLQDIMVANEIQTKTHHQNQRSNNNNNNQHNCNHNQPNQPHQQLQQQQQSHQFYKTASHQHNNLKPTVTIV